MQSIQYYNPQPLLSYNALFNFILDVRGRGKTFTLAKKRSIDRFLDNKTQFIYLRRYKIELQDISTFFTDIQSFYPNNTLTVKGRTFYCDNEIMGYAINLSTANMKKSVAFPNVSTIIFDEFILEKGFVRYLPNEVKTFLNFYETVARTREDVKVFFIGNSISITNPYFLEYKIIPRQNQRFTSTLSHTNEQGVKEHLMIVEIGQDDDNFRNLKAQSKIGIITRGSTFSETSYENKFSDGHDSFIAKKDPQSLYVFAITYANQTYGIWISGKTGTMTVSKSYSKSDKFRNFVLSTEDHRPNMVLIDNFKKLHHMQRIKQAFQQGYLMFENVALRNSFYDILKLILT